MTQTHGWNSPPAEPREGVPSPWAAAMLSTTDYCLGAVVVLVPLVFGARFAPGRLVLIALSAVACCCWCIHQSLQKQATWRSTLFTQVLLVACGLVVFQVTPLPTHWLERLSPNLHSLLPLWNSGTEQAAELGTWNQLSVNPQASRVGLATLLAYGMLFVTVTQRIQSTADVERLLRWLAWSAAGMALFGFVQYAFSNGRYFWCCEIPFANTHGRIRGSFTGPNHFASFLVLGLIPQAYAFFLKRDSDSQSAFTAKVPNGNPHPRTRGRGLGEGVSALALLTTALAILLSLSKGGIGAMSVAILVAGLLLFATGTLRGRHQLAALVLIAAGAGVLSVYGMDQVNQRFAELQSDDLTKVDSVAGRLLVWKANLAAIQQGGLCGWGIGTHSDVYPAFLSRSFRNEFTHAENGFLQVGTEAGPVGLTLLAATVLFVLGWSYQAIRYAPSAGARNCAIAIVASLGAFLAHAVVDFVWYVPACLAVATMLAACLLRLAQMATDAPARTTPQPTPRLQWLAAAAVGFVAGGWALSTLIGPALGQTAWHRYLLASKAKEQFERYQATQQNEPTTNDGQYQIAVVKNLITQLAHTVQENPNHARAHARLSANYLVLFDLLQAKSENPLPASQIRSAALASQFVTPNALREWLDRAVGKPVPLLYLAHHHALRAARLTPLDGDAYILLAKLSFLTGNDPRAVDRCLHQALVTRPHQGDVLFSVGHELLLVGQVEEALNHWQKCFGDLGQYQGPMLGILASAVPADTLIQTFQPDLSALLVLWHYCRDYGREADYLAFERRAYEIATGENADLPPVLIARNWRLLWEIDTLLGKPEDALAHLQRGLEAVPGDYQLRRQLACALADAGDYQEADPHLRWCLAQQPDDALVNKKLADARRAWFQERTAIAAGRSDQILRR